MPDQLLRIIRQAVGCGKPAGRPDGGRQLSELRSLSQKRPYNHRSREAPP
jgi:hypothetical protein